jgi:hypothetical protein
MKPARVSTIVWGVALLLIAASSFAFVAWDVELVQGFTLVHVVVGFGALLVVAALVGAIAQLTRRPEVVTGSTRDEDQPVD